ncbi:MAG TPA: hypothetical protein VFV87_12510 [Pirellulaceae bacterium]|nr:hypothetical protein [Pirellulaceae bacterium]
MSHFLKSLLRKYPNIWGAYEVFQRLERWPRIGEAATLAVDAAKQWQLELEELKRIQDRTTDWPFSLQSKWHEHWNKYGSKRDAESAVNDVIDRALQLCNASIASGNPIEFYW